VDKQVVQVPQVAQVVQVAVAVWMRQVAQVVLLHRDKETLAVLARRVLVV
jgi:hypothetical protein